MAIDPEDFGKSFQGFMQHMSASAPTEPPLVQRLLTRHFGASPSAYPTLSESFAKSDQANLQLALDTMLAADGTTHELLGVPSAPHEIMAPSFSTLLSPSRFGPSGTEQDEVPVEYSNVSISDTDVRVCVQRGLFLIESSGDKLAVLIGQCELPHMAQLSLEVMAPSREVAERFLAAIRRVIREKNVYRGQVLSIEASPFGAAEIKIHTLPTISRDDIILPRGVLERIERQTIRFSQLSDKLRAAKRHLKRGILLHGPPGTGKTLTAMYVARAIKDRTVLLLAGVGQGSLAPSCALARTLQPSVVILEDVDLIAERRDEGAACTGPLLFELLNQMDGLSADVDVLFLLTTNRPDLIEPALASRPGRVDMAIEIPLPDADCRGRLIELYGRGLNLKLAYPELFVERTEGASAAFMRELMRTATLIAADEDAEVVIDRHLDEALHELIVNGGPLTQQLLGFAPPEDE